MVLVIMRLRHFNPVKTTGGRAWGIFFLKLSVAMLITLWVYSRRCGGWGPFLAGFHGVAWQLIFKYYIGVAILLVLTLLIMKVVIGGFRQKGVAMKIIQVGGMTLLYVLLVRVAWGVNIFRLPGGAGSRSYTSFLTTPAFDVYNIDFPVPENKYGAWEGVRVPLTRDGHVPNEPIQLKLGDCLVIVTTGGLSLSTIADNYQRMRMEPVDRVTPEAEPLFVNQASMNNGDFPCSYGQYAGLVMSIKAPNGVAYQYVPAMVPLQEWTKDGQSVLYLVARQEGTLLATYNVPLDVPYYVNMVKTGRGNLTTRLWVYRVSREDLKFLPKDITKE
jgi:hypothetical protein